MNRYCTRVVSVLLALILILGVMPTIALAGPSIETIENASVFVSPPIAGNHPNLTGIPCYSNDPFTVDDVHFFELDANGNPMGQFLDESYTFVAGQEYACQVILVPNANYAFSESDTACDINRKEAQFNYIDSDGTAYYTVHFTAAAGSYTVTFDANGSTAAPPAPIQVPYGGCVWDAIPSFDAVRMPDQPFEEFQDWTLDPFATSLNSFYDFNFEVKSDLTLYAIWSRCEKSIDLFVEVPQNCLEADVYHPTVATPENANSFVETDHFYSGLVDGHLHYDLVYVGPFTKGLTYYSHVYVYGHFGATLPKINLYGARLISTTRVSGSDDDYDEIEVIFSVTPPAGDSLTEASVFINTPKAGDSAISSHPVVTSLTPGATMQVKGWYTTTDVQHADFYDGVLEGGKTYYALVGVSSYFNAYQISYQTLKLNVFGKNAKLVKMVDWGSWDAIPNFAGALVAVTIPNTYQFVVEIPGGNGKIRWDRGNGAWVTIMDFGGVEEGSVTLEAKPEPGYEFKQWYDANTYETLSKKSTYTFNLNKDVHLKASFVWKPFEDVGAWDYFYEPVVWAVQNGITTGTDATHFSPKKECTRADVVTFLWRANGSPEPSSSTNPFTDVKSSAYYYKAVLWAVEKGITKGATAITFKPKGICTREQVITFLWRAKGEPKPGSGTNPFVDVSSSSYAYNAILWAVNTKPAITTGTNATHFSPKANCNRAQVVTFLARAYGPAG